jgi:hypothetical protein
MGKGTQHDVSDNRRKSPCRRVSGFTGGEVRQRSGSLQRTIQADREMVLDVLTEAWSDTLGGAKMASRRATSKR